MTRTADSRTSADTRAIYEERVLARLDEVSADIDALHARAQGLADDAKAACKQQLYVLRELHVQAGDHLHELRSASDGAWQTLTRELDELLRVLSDGVARMQHPVKFEAGG